MKAHRLQQQSPIATESTAKDGAALGMVLIVLSVLALVGNGIVHLGAQSGVEASRYAQEAKAFWNAEAGLQIALAVAAKHSQPMERIGSGAMYGNDVVAGTTSTGSYAVDITEDPSWVNTGNTVKRYVITSTGTTLSGASRTVNMRASLRTFANYVWSTHREETSSGGNIYFATGDILDGEIYSNDQLNIYGTPRFLAHVYSAVGSVNYRNGGTDASFEAGHTVNAPTLDFQGQYADHVDTIKDEADDAGLSLSGGYDVTFNSDGTMTYRVDNGGGSYGTNQTADISTLNGAIYIDGDATVRGTLDGNVTLAVEGEIRIDPAGVLYESASSPKPTEAGFDDDAVDDSLGLVAREAVIIEGGSDIDIHASILVTDGDSGFTAEEKYTDHGQPYINLYGSIAQWRRGIVGRSSGAGFLKNYMYNPNLLDDPPPFFPYSGYTFTEWSPSG